MPNRAGTPQAGTDATPATSSARRGMSWEQFAAEVAGLADCQADAVDGDTRLIEDLGLDSLSLTELVVILIERHDMYSLSKTLEERSWEHVTARALYDEYLTGVPPSARSSSTA